MPSVSSSWFPMVSLRSSPLTGVFQQFIESLQTSCLICSPYISAGPVSRMLASVEKRHLQGSLRVQVVTDITLPNLVQQSTDISALIQLTERLRHVTISYLPRIHAKVYISGADFALVTSANFTDGGVSANREYGVAFEDPILIERIRTDIEAYAYLGGLVGLQRLKDLNSRVAELRATVLAEQHSIDGKLRAAAAVLEREAEDQLLRSRVEGRSIFGVFGDTILYLLSSGPMGTVELHERIRDIHPDLCDDSLDRVIDGQHFGKLWKHQVRTAQQHLKQTRRVAYDPSRRLWSRASPV
jgi:hypothetical protein